MMTVCAAALAAGAVFAKTEWRTDLVGRTLTMTDREANAWAEALAADYPGLVRIGSLGESREGRRMTLLTVTDFSTGAAEAKRAIYVQGGIHSRELSGPVAALYLARRLAEEHRPGGLLATCAFYIVPRVNPDGSERMVRMPGDERSGWGDYHDTPNLIDMYDLDGDGVIAFMRIEDPKGPFCRSEKNPDCLVARTGGSKGPFYFLGQEGLYRNWDGKSKIWEDWWREYLDYNRNYPYEWTSAQYGAGKRPCQHPEVANEVAFLRAHTNICACLDFHNGYGMVFSHPVYPDDRARYDALAEKAAELTGFPRFDGFTQAFGADARPPCSRGRFDDYVYNVLGAPNLTIELGTRETSAGLSASYFTTVKDNPYTAPYAVIAHERKLKARNPSYLPWRKFEHPQLGAVEIGGRVSTYFTNPLPEDLARTCERAFEFARVYGADVAGKGPFGRSRVMWPELSAADRARFDRIVFPERTAELPGGTGSLALGRDGVLAWCAGGRTFTSANRGISWTEGAARSAGPTDRLTPCVAKLMDGRDIRFLSRGDALAVELSADGGRTFAHTADLLYDAGASGEWSVSFAELPANKIALVAGRGGGARTVAIFDASFPFAKPSYDIHTKALTPVAERNRPAGQELALVHECKLNFALVRAKRFAQALQPAVDVLVEAFERRTGKRPDVVDAEDAAAVARHPLRILVGDTPETRANGVVPEKLPEQGFEVKTFAEGLILCGFDSRCMKGWRKGPLDTRGDSLGTYFAALDFAERFLGIRWYFPGPHGTTDPGFTRHFSVTPVDYVDAPYFDRRNADRYFFFTTVWNAERLAHWRPYLGEMKLRDTSFADKWRCFGVKPRGGNHCPEPRALAKKFPDDLRRIFFTSPVDGKFWYNAKEHIGNYYNVFDLGFADFIVEAWKQHYATDGKDSCFGGNLNATALSFGLCDTSIPLKDARAVPVVKELGLITDEDVAAKRGMANVYGRFFRHLAGRAKEEFPDKKLFLLCYADAANAPVDPQWFLPDNVEIMLCDGRLPLKIRDGRAPEATMKRFTEWSRALGGRPIARVWLYSNGLNRFARAVGPELVKEVPKALGGLLGREELFYDYWGSDDLWHYFYSAYAMYKSMWNPDFDQDAALSEMWRDLFGDEAGRHMDAFHRRLVRMHADCYAPAADAYPVYPLETLDALAAELAAAKDLVAGDEVRLRRFGLVADYLDEAFVRERNRATYVPPVHDVKPRPADVTLDGIPDEPFWRDVAPVPMRDPKGGNAVPAGAGELRLVRDGKGLWGSFTAPRKDVSDPKKGIWANDTLEFLFLPGKGREIVYQLAYDPVGGTFRRKQRLLPIAQPSDNSWTAPGTVFKAHRGENGWTAEFFFPLSIFEDEIREGETCAFNFVHTSPSSPRIYAGSSLTLGNNQNTMMFGSIRFAR